MQAMRAGSLPTGWLGVSRVGFEPCAAGSHPLGHDNEFHELPPNSLVSGFLGATMPLLGAAWTTERLPDYSQNLTTQDLGERHHMA